MIPIQQEFDIITIKQMCENAGFRIFKDKIVACDNGSSGDASKCAVELVRQVQFMLLSREAE
jgi:hypothetical protein